MPNPREIPEGLRERESLRARVCCLHEEHPLTQLLPIHRGIYPRGGCCKICQSVRHLAKDCPEKGTSKDKKAQVVGGELRDKSAGAFV